MIDKNEKDLDLDAPWAIGEASFKYIVSLIRAEYGDTPRLLELGSGISTARLGLAFPEGRVVSIEHDREHFVKNRRLLDQSSVSNVELVYLKDGWMCKKCQVFHTYDKRLSLMRIGEVDAIIIDGPPYFMFRGREGAFHLVEASLKEGGIIILDDYNRGAEKEAVYNWAEIYRGISIIDEKNAGHGLCVLRKNGNDAAKLSIGVSFRNVISVLQYVRRRAESFLRAAG